MVDMSGLLQLLSIWVSHWVQQRGHNEQHPHRAVIIIQGEESIGHGIAKLDPDHPRALVMPFLSVTASLLDTLAAVEILNNINVISWGSRTDGFLGGDQILAKPEARRLSAVASILIGLFTAYNAGMDQTLIFQPNYGFKPKARINSVHDKEIDDIVHALEEEEEEGGNGWEVIQLRHGGEASSVRTIQLYDQYVRGFRAIKRDTCGANYALQNTDAVLVSRRGMKALLEKFWPGFLEGRPLAIDEPGFTFDFRSHLGSTSPALLLFNTLPRAYVSTWPLFTDLDHDVTTQPSSDDVNNAERAVVRKLLKRQAFGTLKPIISNHHYAASSSTLGLGQGASSSTLGLGQGASDDEDVRRKGLDFLILEHRYARLDEINFDMLRKGIDALVINDTVSLGQTSSVRAVLEAAARSFMETCYEGNIKCNTANRELDAQPEDAYIYPIRLHFFYQSILHVITFNQADVAWPTRLMDYARVWGSSQHDLIFAQLEAMCRYLLNDYFSSDLAVHLRRQRLLARQQQLRETVDAFTLKHLSPTMCSEGPVNNGSEVVCESQTLVASLAIKECGTTPLSHSDVPISASVSSSSLPHGQSFGPTQNASLHCAGSIVASSSKDAQPEIAVFFHIGMIGPAWREISTDLMQSVESSGLLNASRHVYVTAVGSGPSDIFTESEYNQHPRIIIDRATDLLVMGEFTTLARLQAYCHHHPEALVWYIHNKGTTRATRSPFIYASALAWGQYMTHFVVRQYANCLYTLTEANYDVVGVEYHEGHHHYQGNFWAAKCQHINHLPDIPSSDIQNRGWGEDWIFSLKNKTACRFWSCGSSQLDLYRHVIDPSYYEDWDCKPPLPT